MKDLAGRVALITGAASGLGAGLARVCAAAGMRVVASDRQESSLADVCGEIVASGGTAAYEVADLLDREAGDRLVAAAQERFGGLHLVVNNAGVMTVTPLVESRSEDWDWLLGVNLMGAARVVSAAVPVLRAGGEAAHILNIASMSGLAPALEPPIGVYAASKSALVSYSEVLAHELESDGIAVSVACPGGMSTGIFEADLHRPQQFWPGGARPKVAPGSSGLEGLTSPDETARRILEGVRHDRFYIFTHTGEWERLRVHWERMRADFDAVRDGMS